jgi:ParB-like chromosome segregation protein Spo0J
MAQHQAQVFSVGGRYRPVNSDGGEPAAEDLDLRHFEHLPIREAPVNALSPGPFLREAGTNAAHVQLLVSAADSSALPPILVQQDGGRVIDGLHRLAAAKIRGDRVIKARFLDCTDSQALVLAIKANSAHGFPLSKADRVSGAKRVVAEHPDWSDRSIAGITGLSAKTIASLRDRSAGQADPDGKRLGRDGRRRPVSAGAGRHRAAQYLSAHPDAPLRQVAQEADVSLGTVHDVSARLRRGASPEPGGPERGGHRPPARKNHVDAPAAWTAVVTKMAGDPSVRYTEGGKEFLRWMTQHAADPAGWRTFINTIPAHWADVIAPIAEAIGREWHLYAQRLEASS